jgi:hypothetical protein
MIAGRMLLLPLVAYVALDFANPLMPGAVHFDGGSMDVVDGARLQPMTHSPPIVLVTTPETVVDRPVPSMAPYRRRLVSRAGRQAETRIRRALPLSSGPGPLVEGH